MSNPPTSPDLSRRKPELLAFYLAIGIALSFHVVAAAVSLHRTMDADPFCWASTNEMTSARSYAQLGIVGSQGLQIVNNPPVGARPDVYTHWPPLFPMLLSRAFLVAGESEATARTFALAGSLALAAAFFWLALIFFGWDTAVIALLALLGLPAFAVFTRLVLGVNLSLACMVVALVCFLRAIDTRSWRWAIVGCVSFAGSVLLRWEPLMLAPALLAEAFISRSSARIKLASVYALVGGGVVLSVLGGYLVFAPWLRSELWHTALYRTGLEAYSGTAATLNELPYRLYFAQNPTPSISRWMEEAIFRFVNGPGALGLLATIAVVYFAFSRPAERRLRVILVGLLGPWLLWWVTMRNQVFDNGFEIMIAAPGVALCLGLAAEFLSFDLLTTKLAPWALALVLTLPLWQHLEDVRVEKPATDGVSYSRDIQRLTGPAAIVLTPYDGMETVYYTRRHVVRSIRDDAAINEALSRVDSSYPGAPVYLALPPGNVRDYPQSVERSSVAASTEHLLLLKLRCCPIPLK